MMDRMHAIINFTHPSAFVHVSFKMGWYILADHFRWLVAARFRL
jgi:hypothetical protein